MCPYTYTLGVHLRRLVTASQRAHGEMRRCVAHTPHVGDDAGETIDEVHENCPKFN